MASGGPGPASATTGAGPERWKWRATTVALVPRSPGTATRAAAAGAPETLYAGQRQPEGTASSRRTWSRRQAWTWDTLSGGMRASCCALAVLPFAIAGIRVHGTVQSAATAIDTSTQRVYSSVVTQCVTRAA